MIRKCLAIALPLALLGLNACERENPSPTAPVSQDGTGSARIALPKLPAGYVDSGQQALFSLTISGSGMTPIRKSWYLGASSQPVVVAGIPAGIRYFQGRLVRVDPGRGDTLITHEGADSAYIQRDSTTEVYLYLHAGGTGSAHICLEVEGWPADPTCIVRPPVPPVSACYDLTLSPQPSGKDGPINGILRIDQQDTLLFGRVIWNFGRVDTSFGRLLPGPTFYFGNPGGFQFKATPDSVSGLLRGWFIDPVLGLDGYSGNALGRPTSCLPESLPPPPPIPHRSIAGCYRLQVSPNGSDSALSADLRILQGDGSTVVGIVTWGPGQSDTLTGTLFPGVFDTEVDLSGPGGLVFKPTVDGSGRMSGYFVDQARGIEAGWAYGYPGSCAIAPPPGPAYPNVAGCYALVVAKPGPAEDSLFKGKLRLIQKDRTLLAEVIWSPMAKDTATGFVSVGVTGETRISIDAGKFTLSATWDSSLGLRQLAFHSVSRGIDGQGSAAPAACDSAAPPNETVRFDSLECWTVSQNTTDGRAMKGTLWVGWRGAHLAGLFRWAGNGITQSFAVDNGGLPDTGAVLYLFGNLPAGFGHPAVNALERGHYKARMNPDGLRSGAAYARAGTGDFQSGDKFADWGGTPNACPEEARPTLAVLMPSR